MTVFIGMYRKRNDQHVTNNEASVKVTDGYTSVRLIGGGDATDEWGKCTSKDNQVVCDTARTDRGSESRHHLKGFQKCRIQYSENFRLISDLGIF